MTGVSSPGLAVHDGGTYPGVILPCWPLGVVELVQEGAKGPIENPRLILMPIWHNRKAADLPTRVKTEIEQFFLSVTFFTDKPHTNWSTRASPARTLNVFQPLILKY
jgi:hypothetical protein